MEIDLPQLLERLERLEAENARLRQRVQQLEAQLDARSSKTSNRPPSTDSPTQRSRRNKRKRSNRTQGAQKGHPGHERQRLDPTLVVELIPETCAHCAHALEGRDPHPRIHQFVDLPPIQAEVLDYHLHALECAGCGHTTRAKTPQHVGQTTYGPGLVSLAATLTGPFQLSRRQAQRFFAEVIALPISLGTLSNFEKSASQALEPAYDQARQTIRQAPAVFVDETPWYQTHGHCGYAWGASTRELSVYRIHSSRAKTGFEELMGQDYDGICVSDRYVVYTSRKRGGAQYCWAHLLRLFDSWASRDGPLGEVAEELGWLGRWVFRLWRWRTGRKQAAVELSDEQWTSIMAVTRERVFDALARGAAREDAASWMRTLLADEAQLWTWVEHPELEPSNNMAERQMRRLVLARKGSFGSESERGDRFIERIYTVCETLRKQGRNLAAFIRDCVNAHLRGTQPPALLT